MEGALRAQIEKGSQDSVFRDLDERLYQMTRVPEPGKTAPVYVNFNIFRHTDGEMTSSAPVEYARRRWGDGPNIPLFAKARVRDSRGKAVDAPKALGNVKFLWDWECVPEEVRGASAVVFDAPHVYHLDVNLEDPILRDARVRRALLHAIDRDAIVQGALGGHGRVAHSWLSPQHPAIDPRIRRRFHDPEAAGRLLDEAGLRLGPDGWRRDAAGNVVRFAIARSELHPPAVIDAIVRDWARVGIAGVNQPVEDDYYFGEYTQRLQWPHFSFEAVATPPYDTGFAYWVESQIPAEANGWRGLNFSRWREPRVEAIYQELLQTLNPDDVVEVLQRQQEIWAEELPTLPLYTTEQAVLLGPGLEGIRPHPMGEALLGWNAAEWRFSSRKRLKTATALPAAAAPAARPVR